MVPLVAQKFYIGFDVRVDFDASKHVYQSTDIGTITSDWIAFIEKSRASAITLARETEKRGRVSARLRNQCHVPAGYSDKIGIMVFTNTTVEEAFGLSSDSPVS